MRLLELKCKCITTELSEEELEEYGFDSFDDDLIQYADGDFKIEHHLYSVIPQIEYGPRGVMYLKMFVYYNRSLEMPESKQTAEIIDFVRGQISDGWGENGFVIDGQLVEFDWKNIKVVSDKEYSYDDILVDYNSRNKSKFYDEQHGYESPESLFDTFQELHRIFDEIDDTSH